MAQEENDNTFWKDLFAFGGVAFLRLRRLQECGVIVVICFVLSALEIAPRGWLIFVSGCCMLVIACWHGFQDERRRAKALEDSLKKTNHPDTRLSLTLRFHQQVGIGMMGKEIGKKWAHSHHFDVLVTNLGDRISVESIVVSCNDRVGNLTIIQPHGEVPQPLLPQPLAAQDTMIQRYALPPGLFVEILKNKPLLTVKTSDSTVFTLDDEAFQAMKSDGGVPWQSVIVHKTRQDIRRECGLDA